MNHKVLITTSGIGSRLGELTQYTNKALVRVGTRPAISHIVESYPRETQFVITLGHFGSQVRDFLDLAYPDRSFEYIPVPAYEGPGTSLGLSMLAAKSALQCPFIYHASDTIVTQEARAPEKNWIGVVRGNDTSQYASWTLQEGKLQFHEKGAIDADFLHIGLIGINDFSGFWSALERLYKADPNDQSLNDCRPLREMIAQGSQIDIVEYPLWHDIGNATALQNAKKAFGDSLDDLGKLGQEVFMLSDCVIKFFADTKIVRERVERGRLLQGFVPVIEGEAGNFFRYRFVPGELYSHTVQPADFKKFLQWVQSAFWKPEGEVDAKAFTQACRGFYKEKTQKRVAQFLEANNLEDSEHVINGENIPTVAQMLAQVDFDFLSDGLQSRFHGDFILDNIVRTADGYCLIDWRQDFGGLLRGGDRYYDLAKLNHNLVVNHRIINQGHISVLVEGKTVTVDVLRPSTLVECQEVFSDFLKREGYDRGKVEMLTALIWLNMASLHHHPFNLFLYYFGKLHLWRALQEK